MDQTLDHPTPGRQTRWRRLFTPWKWPRWLLITMVGLTPVAYTVSAVPVVYALHRLGLHRSPIVFTAMTIVYFPLGWLEKNSPPCRKAIDWQMTVMRSTFGEPEP